MIPEQLKVNPNFIGRVSETRHLQQVAAVNQSAIIVVHGRRRVGKTELVEHTFRTRNILKFEGIEGQTEKVQQREFLRKLALYSGQTLYTQIDPHSWVQIFEMLADLVKEGIWTIFLEELQWMANYDSKLIAELKVVWDNKFRHNSRLLLVLCGSSPSFMIDKVVMSRALYGRSMHELALKPFSLNEIGCFLGEKHIQRSLDADLLVGGMPAYLKFLSQESSIYLSFCNNAFRPEAYFIKEIDKVFLSSLASNPHYRKIVEYLSRVRFSSRGEILKALKIVSGGTNSKLFTDLESSGLIGCYTSLGKGEDSKIARYEISDAYLQSYFKLIKPQLKNIAQGKFSHNPSAALSLVRLAQIRGYAFERWCRKNVKDIAKALGFADVDYDFGPFYNRKIERQSPGFQIDLVFKRADKTYTVCEIKYLSRKLTSEVGEEFNCKLELFPVPQRYRLQKVLIVAGEYDSKLLGHPYFDRVLSIEDIAGQK